MRVLVTGCAGFIGMHVCQLLLARGDEVLGLDNLNAYYDPRLKRARLEQLQGHDRFNFVKADIADASAVNRAFTSFAPQRVVNLAAQAGVRYSLKNPSAYISSNVAGFCNILEACRHHRVEHLVYASSSSVYGANAQVPFSTQHPVDHPVSLYAATKRANELMAHTYSHLYELPTTGLRYFTVYGPWGRPDMSPWLFTSAILEGRPIDVFNFGQMQRDFTYVDDIALGTVKVLDHVPGRPTQLGTARPDRSTGPFKVFNIGNHQPVELMDFISTLEDCLGKKATKRLLPMQAGDVHATYADTEELRLETGFAPSTALDTGLRRWSDWYLNWTRQPVRHSRAEKVAA